MKSNNGHGLDMTVARFHSISYQGCYHSTEQPISDFRRMQMY